MAGLRHVSGWAALIAGLAVPAAGCARLPAPVADGADGSAAIDVEQLDVSGAVAVRVAARVIGAGSETATVWPGFWPADTEFVIRPVAGGALYVSPRRDARIAGLPLRGAGSASLRGRAVVLPDTTAQVPLDFDYRVGDRSVLAISVFGGPGLDPEFTTLLLLYHEAFHRYQQSAFSRAWGHGPLDVIEIDGRVLTDPEIRATLAVERSILREALRQGTGQERVALVRSYLAVRAQRRQRTPASVQTREAQLERTEGSAQLVGYRAALLASDGSAARLTDLIAEHLLDPALHDAARDGLRRHAYATGAAMGLLLDGFGGNWRRSLQEGAAFHQLLATAVSFDPADHEALATTALERFRFADWANRFRAEGAATDPLEAFEAAPGTRLVIVGFAPDRSSYRGRTSEAVSGTLLFESGTLLTLRSGVAFLESRGHAALEDRRAGSTSYVVLLPAPPLVNGALPVAGESTHSAVVVASDGLELRIEWPVSTAWDGRTLTVTIEPGWRRPPP